LAQSGDLRKTQAGQWQGYYDGAWHDSTQGFIDLLDSMGIYNVTGSGPSMNLLYDTEMGVGALNATQWQDTLKAIRAGSAGTAGTATDPMDFRALWDANMGQIPFPNIFRYDEKTGEILKATDPDPIDPAKFLDAVRAYEAVNGQVGAPGQPQLFSLGDNYKSDIVVSPEGGVTKIDKADKPKAAAPLKPGEYEVGPGRLREDIGVQLPGYDVLEQRTGELSAIQQKVDPSYIIDPKTMQPYFQQPDGSLQAAPTPSVDDQISMHLVEGNMDAAVSKANFRDRPTSLEYFNAAMDWARTPADIFTISAIVRGIFEPTPGPMGELRRVGAPPAWATQAWVGLQNSMGIPTENMTSTPGAESGTVSDMTVASSSGLVPNNFTGGSTSPVTLDGGRTANITGDTTVDALDDAGNFVGSMTADMATSQGFDFSGKDAFAAAVDGGDDDGSVDWRNLESEQGFGALTTDQQYGSLVDKLVDSGRFGTGIDAYNAIREAITADLGFNVSIEARLEWLQNELGDGGDGGIGEGDVIGVTTDDIPFTQAHEDLAASLGMDVEQLFQEATTFDEGLVTDSPIEIGEEGYTGLDPQVIQARINLGLDPLTGEYIDSDSPFIGGDDADIWREIETDAERTTRIGTGATFPTATPDWLTSTAGGDDYFVPQGAIADRGNIDDPMFRAGQQPSSANRGNIDDPMFAGDPYANISSANYIPGYRVGNVNQFLPRPGAQESTLKPWERTKGRLIQAGNLDPYSAGTLDFIPDEFIPEPTRARGEIGRPGGTGPSAGALKLRAEAEERRRKESIVSPLAEPQYYGPEGGRRRIDTDIAAQMYAPYEYEESAPIIPVYDEPEPEPAPAPAPAYVAPEIFEEDMGFAWSDPEPVVEEYMDTGASEEAYWSGYGEGAKGTRTDDRFTLVGEEGPELALFPRGTEIVPLNRPAKPKQRRRLRSQFSDAIDSFAFGGFSNGGPALVGEMGPELVDLPPGAQVMPAGITEMMTGRPTRQPRSLMRQAGMRAPSAQTISNLLPEEIEVYQEMGRLAGIPEKAFEREFRSMVPMGQGGTQQARFAPRRTGRTRYGSI